MTRLVLRGMAEHRLRSALTGLAVLLGVAMIASAYVETAAINRAFGNIEETAYRGVAAAVTARTAFHSQYSEAEPFPQQIVRRLAAVPGVARAEGQLAEMGQLVVRGKHVNTTGAPSLVLSTLKAPFAQIRAVSGRLPTAPGEIAIDGHTAQVNGVKVGEIVGIGARLGLQRVRVVGTLSFGGGTSIGGATLVYAPLADIQRWYGARGDVSAVVVAAAPGVSPNRLVARIDPVLPSDLRVRTGQAQASHETREITNAIGSFLTPILLALAGAALLVGAFIIFNTFSITVAQRTREFALLRSIGASRAQVLAAVAGEALVLGITASALGVVAGLGFAAGINALFEAANFGIPHSGLALTPGAVTVAFGVGVGVTLASAVVPAMRATRVPPIAALQRDAATRRPSRLAPWIAAIVFVLSIVAFAAGLFAAGGATARLSTLGGGVVLFFVGMALSARWFARPLAGLIGLPIARVFHEPGRIARENAMRNPARTAATSAALMVGVGLVVFVAVFAAGVKSSIATSLDRYVRADFIVAARPVQPLPAGAGPRIARTPGVSASSALYIDQIKVGSAPVNASIDQLDGVDARSLRKVYSPDWIVGSDALLAHMGRDDALIEQQFARAHNITVGGVFAITTPSGRRAVLRAVGEYKDPEVLQGVIVDRSTFAEVSSQRDPFVWLVKLAPGAGEQRVRAGLTSAVKPFPPAEVQSLAEYRQTLDKSLNQLVDMLYSLLGVCLLISLLGLANSLLLSIHERTHEFGLLRAVGATRSQVRRIVRYESVITAVIGGLLGIVVGICFAALVTVALSNLGLGFSVPVLELALFLALAVVVGVVGAIGPARRGSRVDIISAVQSE